jgi:hypothetical protein
MSLRASVGSTEAAKGVVERVGVVGPKRAARQSVRARTVKQICEHHDIDPVAYLQDIIGRLPSRPTEQFQELQPDVWFASHSSAWSKTAA